jgi:hypothetical protein
MAESFETLGAGNGFSSCLQATQVLYGEILNPPSLAQTMNAYWNFDSVSWGGAFFNPDSQPKDLICNPTANVGNSANGDSNPGYPGEFTVRNSLPRIFFKNGVKYYSHGIRMSFSASTYEELSNGSESSSIEVVYFSSLYTSQENQPYTCVTDQVGEPGDEEDIGKTSSEFNFSVSSVTISGIPFIKTVTKSRGGSNYKENLSDPLPECPNPSFPLEPGPPSLNLHTY